MKSHNVPKINSNRMKAQETALIKIKQKHFSTLVYLDIDLN